MGSELVPVRRGAEFWRVGAAAAAGCAVMVALSGRAAVGEEAATPCGPCATLPRPGDQVWMVSCRGLECPTDDAAARLKYWQFNGHRWVAASREAFREAGDPFLTTTVFVPGNGYTIATTRELGWLTYRRFAKAAPRERPWRLVIWSWPSDRVERRPAEDVRVKAARTVPAAQYLAAWLEELDTRTNVSLVGTSLGARIVGGALHLRAGGALAGHVFTGGSAAPRQPYRVVLVSAAIDNDWLSPGRQMGQALKPVERMLIVKNSNDPLLKHYHWMYGRTSSARALGYAGLACAACPSAERDKIRQFDAAGMVGRKHGFRHYLDSPTLLARMAPYVFCRDSSRLWAPNSTRAIGNSQADRPRVGAR